MCAAKQPEPDYETPSYDPEWSHANFDVTMQDQDDTQPTEVESKKAQPDYSQKG